MNVGSAAQIFLPMMMQPHVLPGWRFLEDRRSRFAHVYGRLRPGCHARAGSGQPRALFHAIRERELTEGSLSRAVGAARKQEFLNARDTGRSWLSGSRTLASNADAPAPGSSPASRQAAADHVRELGSHCSLPAALPASVRLPSVSRSAAHGRVSFSSWSWKARARGAWRRWRACSGDRWDRRRCCVDRGPGAPQT